MTLAPCPFEGVSSLHEQGFSFAAEAHRQVEFYRQTRRKVPFDDEDGNRKYQVFATLKSNKCPLEYFRTQQQVGNEYPGVIEVARRVLACPPSTAPVERLFSVAGQIDKGAKYRLSEDSLALTTTLREVWDMI